MSLIINHNLLAMKAAQGLTVIYRDLASASERLSSGLRINSASDDPAGLAVREIMRSDIAALNQGIRNASDAISLIQTAEGALSVIDEKLIRMKELAEQAATGTYTTTQRVIMNSEYQAMADEVDRLANAAVFNDYKLLDGTLQYFNKSEGMKIHFGTGNDPGEDYYFINIGDMRATAASGLRIGGDGDNDIWAQGGVDGCCGTGGQDSLTASIEGVSGKTFAYAYNYDQNADMDPNGTGSAGLETHPSYLGGIYRASSGWSLLDLINEVNTGSQSRVKVDFNGAVSAGTWNLGSGAVNVVLGNEVYQFISGSTASAFDASKDVFKVLDTAILAGSALAQAINQSSQSFWALQQGDDVYVFQKTGGDYDYLAAYDRGIGASGSAAAATYVNWQNMESYQLEASATTFGNGGELWAALTAVQTSPTNWGVRLEGRDVGDRYDLRIADTGAGSGYDIDISGMGFDTGVGTLAGYSQNDFIELQDAADPIWDGAEIRTQSAAQAALEAVTEAILKKDGTRADLGALHSRLENTVTALTLQAGTLQEAESRISDVDVAYEITEFTKSQILAQAATAIVAQANSFHDLALTLLT